MDERIGAYLKELCQQIRFRQAHERIRREFACHILDQRDALIARGMNEDAATERSLRLTGDAVELGAELDRVHRPKPQWRLLILCLALLFIGQALQRGISKDFSIALPSLLLGVTLLCVCYLADLGFLREIGLGVYGLAVAMYGVLLLQKRSSFAFTWDFGTMRTLGTLGLLFPLLYAGLLYGLRGRSYGGIAVAQLAYAATLLLFALLPSLLGLWIFGLCGLGLLLFAHSRRWFHPTVKGGTMALLGPLFVALCMMTYLALTCSKAALAVTPPYFSDPDLVPRAVYDILSNTQLLGTGGTLSEEGCYLLKFLQEQSTIFTDLQLGLVVLAYRCGWLAVCLVLLPLLALLVIGFLKWVKVGNDLARFVSLSVLLTMSFQVGAYLLRNLGFTMEEGAALPLLTGGNVSFVIHMCLLGCLLACFRSGNAWAEGPPRWKQELEQKKKVRCFKKEGKGEE